MLTSRHRPAVQRGLAGIGIAVVLALALACGGGDGLAISEAEASTATNDFLATTLGLFTGTTEPQAFIDQYAPECREGVDPESLAFVAAFMQGMAPELQGVVIEAVDVGVLHVRDGEGGVLVTPQDPSALRVQVEGQFVPASVFFGEAGFVATEETLVEPLLLVREGGNVYLGDCEELRSLAGGLPGS